MKYQRSYELERDSLSPNKNIAPITAEIDTKERLSVGGCTLSDLAKRYGTPLYIIDETTLRVSCRAYRDSLSKTYQGDSLAIYASKANSSLAITKIVSSEGLGIDVVSSGELITALKGGVKKDKIFLHGNNKSDDELLLAYNNNVNIILDNEHDLNRLEALIPKNSEPVNLMLRLTPGIECHTHEYIKTGHLDSKFGFDPDKFESILHRLKKFSFLHLKGLHAHIGSQIFELEPHRDLAEVLAENLKLAIEIGHPISDINVGGGLGIKYINSDDPPSIQQWVETVSNAITKSCKKRNLVLPRLICEPGRSLIGNSGVTLYKLGAKKIVPGIRTYLSVDGGMSDNPRPITYQSSYTTCLADRPLAPKEETVTIAGKHCESGDVLLKDIALPKSTDGDFLVFFATGAYNASMSSNYNRIPKPAAVLVLNGRSDLIQKRELPEDLLRYDLIPNRLLDVI